MNTLQNLRGVLGSSEQAIPTTTGGEDTAEEVTRTEKTKIECLQGF